MKQFISLLSFLTYLLISFDGFSAPLSGTYTIGGSSPNYATFTAAASALAANGVNGPVTFKVRAGTYTESFTINNITGASSVNHITFQSENGIAGSAIITFSSTTVTLSSAQYIAFKNLTISGTSNPANTGSTTSSTFVLTGNCNYDSLVNCILTAPIAPWTDYTFVVNASQSANANFVMACCHIIGGGFGYETEGSGSSNGPFFYNNTFTDQTYMAIDLLNTNNTIIQGNTIRSHCITSPQYSGPVTGSRFGIILWNGCNNVQILSNKIIGENGTIGEGMYIPTLGGNNFLIANNFIVADQGLNGAYSIGYTVLNNSFRTSSFCVNFWYGASNNIFKNNIFYNTDGKGIFSLTDTANFIMSDYNDFYTSGPIYNYNSTTYLTLADWQTASGFDTHSRTIPPPYLSDTDLHLTNYSSMNFGIPTNLVTTDIDFGARGPGMIVGGDDSGTSIPASGISCCDCNSHIDFTSDVRNICQGSKVNFKDQSTNNANNWKWTFENGSPGFSTSQDPSVTYYVAGTFDVKLVVNNASGTDSLVKTGYITVNSLPHSGNVTATPDTICAGSSSQLSVTGNSGNIQWQFSSNEISFEDIADDTTQVSNINALSQTTYYRVKSSNNCGSDSSVPVKLLVTPLPAPDVSTSDSLICSGDSAQVCSSNTYSLYLWNTVATSSCIEAKNSGGYWLTVTDANGCSAVSSHQNISVYPVPSVSIVVQGDTLSSYNASAFQWRINDTAIAGATGAILIAKQSGDYSLQVTDSNGCVATSNSVHINLTGIDDKQLNSGINLYPNPFTHSLFISASGMQRIEVCDLTGRIVFNESFKSLVSRVQIDLPDLVPGMYFLKIGEENKFFVRPVVKQ